MASWTGVSGPPDRGRAAPDALPWPAEQADLDRLTAAVRRKVGGPAFGIALASGRRLSAEDAAAAARQWIAVTRTGENKSQPPAAGPLTARQVEVALLVARGHTNDQIGDELVISSATARAHVEH